MLLKITAWLSAGVVLAQAQPEQIAKIKSSVTENLSRLPNYTCTETIQRSDRPKIGGRATLMMLETIRLEVAYVDGKELFGWPGAAKIDESDIGKMIDGSTGTGYFALFSHSIFSTPSAAIQYGNAEESEGKPAVRYDYRVPKKSGAYVIKGEAGQATVDFHGSFWVNPTTLDLMRITAAIDDPPAVIGMISASSILDFDRQSIGGSTFVLPRKADLMVVDADGAEHENRLAIASCRQFVGESVIKFDAPVAEPAAATKSPITRILLPDDFTVDFSLDTPVEWANSASGDPVHGTLRDGVPFNGGFVVPKGAGVSGRIAHLAMRGGLYYVQLTLTSLDFEGGHAGLDGRRNGVSVRDLPLIYQSTKFKLARGARLSLHSRLLKSVHNDSIRP